MMSFLLWECCHFSFSYEIKVLIAGIIISYSLSYLAQHKQHTHFPHLKKNVLTFEIPWPEDCRQRIEAEGAEDMKTLLPGQARVYAENREEPRVW